ncbi:MAG: response regulator [Magnetococcales bacterium]|nr:response regulator [Magnetococcales bacterium]
MNRSIILRPLHLGMLILLLLISPCGLIGSVQAQEARPALDQMTPLSEEAVSTPEDLAHSPSSERSWGDRPILYLALALLMVTVILLSGWRHLELRMLNRELRKAKEEAERANLSKSQFLAVMSHEIRTPLNAILGMNQVLAEANLSRELQHHLKVQRRAGVTLLELINDILDLSKLEADRVQLMDVDFRLDRLLDTVTEMVRDHAQEKNLSLEIQVDNEVPNRMMADAWRIRQVMNNLVDNAVKFTQEGWVRIKVRVDSAQRLQFQVSDSGDGIPQEMRDNIFDPFVRLDASKEQPRQGSGLGLSIAKRLVALWGGELSVESIPEQGSIFSFTAPFRPVDEEETDQKTESHTPSPSSHREEALPEERKLRILLAEDSEDNALLIKTFLKREPHKLTIVPNGEEALERIKLEPFDLVLMDMQMPVLDGYAATRAIREWESVNGWKPLPILALTAHAMVGDADKSRQAGCDAHLTKPISKKLLLEAIGEYGH